MRSPRPISLCTTIAIVAFFSRSASAQTAGFAVNRFEPSERGSDWFALESLDLRGHLRPAVGLVGDLARRPLAIYNDDGSVRTSLVDYQLVAHAGANLVLWDRLRVGLDLPVALYQTGSAGTLNGVAYSPPGSFAVGDLRLGADARLVGQYGDAFTLAGGVQLFAPTGSRSDFTGDGKLRAMPRLSAAGDVGPVTYAARIGFQYRGLTDSFAGTSLGSEVVFGVSAGLRSADHKLVVGPEVYGSANVADGDQIFKKRATPVEAILGAHYEIASGFRIGLGAGSGLTRGYGSPSWRALTVAEWAPGIEQPPAPVEPPAAPPPPAPQPEPPPPVADRDGDGIPDAVDACPDVKGVLTNDPKTNGCPPPPDPDRDKDGIPNEQDACPDEPGPKNPDPKKNGCPIVQLKATQIVINEQVKFATGSAVILPASDELLGAVAKMLKDHAEIKKVRVEGHTDNVGVPASNKTLSNARAASVVAWLAGHGIERTRLVSAGYGQDSPIDTNDTPEGRQNNRRVEFRILEQSP